MCRLNQGVNVIHKVQMVHLLLLNHHHSGFAQKILINNKKKKGRKTK